MRKPIIAGNWKMNKTPEEAGALARALRPLIGEAACDIVLCVPFTDLAATREAIAGSDIRLGAQNMHWAEKGAFTGEISADMLRAAGVEYVVLGHSERRQYFAETDESVNRKTLAAVRAGLVPIVCVGETLKQREAGYTDALIAYQTRIALTGLTAAEAAKVVVAYEPVWAIGTGVTATDAQANETCGVVRKAVGDKFGREAAEAVRVQYGGSMNPGNARGLMEQPEIDGGLIGGASLTAQDFAKVVHFER